MAAWQFVEALNEVVENDIIQDLQVCSFYSLMADESTDISVSKNLILYVRYIKSCKSLTRYLKLITLTQGDAETIYTAISHLLRDNNIDKRKLVGWASDGAEVMLGIRSGVQARLKQDVPYLTSIHCVAHREVLAARQAADAIPYFQRVEGIIKSLYGYVSHSSVRMELLHEVLRILETPEIQLKRPQHIRWLSLLDAVEALCRVYESILTCLCQDQNDSVASGLKL